MDYCIETQNLSQRFSILKTYRDLLLRPFQKKEFTALKDVNISIREGELFALLGPNGAGKTTLIKILNTLIFPSSGKAFVKGMDVTRHGKEVRKAIGYIVSDERSFFWRLTGRQNLRFFATLNNLSAVDAGLRISRLLEFVELERDADRMFKDYSTGMRQKLAIARGLLTDPDIIFMDEPTKALDPITALHMRTFVKEKVMEDRKKTVLYATHNLREAEELCDRLAIISQGSIRYLGTVTALKKEFQREIRYVIQVRDAGNDVIRRIALIPSLQAAPLHVNGSSHMYVQFEAVLDEGNRSISKIIDEIIRIGGSITAVYEKEPTLEEVFTKVVLA